MTINDKEQAELRPDAAAIENFLLLMGEMPINIVCIKPGKPAHGRNFTDVKAATRYAVAENDKGANLYWSPATLWREPDQGKSKKEDVAHTRWVFADIDPHDQETREVAQERLRHLTLVELPAEVPRPTVVVSSGYGMQAYWRLKEAVVLPRDAPGWQAAVDEYEGYNNWLVAQFAADGSAKNIDRILRLPGTVNYPTPKKQKLGRVTSMAGLLHNDMALTYALADFGHLPVGEKVRQQKPAPKSEWEPDERYEFEFPRLKLPAALKQKIVNTLPPGTDESDVVWHVVCALARHRVDPRIIFRIITDEDYAISAHVRRQPDPLRYARRQIDKALAAVAAEEERNVATREQMLDEINAEWFVAPVGGKSYVIRSRQDPGAERKELEFFRQSDFELLYANRLVPVLVGVNPKLVPLGTWWLAHLQRKQFKGLLFDPDKPAEFDGYKNMWTGFGVEPVAGDWSLMDNHIRDVIASGDEEHYAWIKKLLAWKVQNPAKLPSVSLMLKGLQGTGKTMFVANYKRLWGQHGIKMASSRFVSKSQFNGQLRDACVVFVDEMRALVGEDADGILKDYITGETLSIDEKYVPVKETKNFCFFMMASDSEHAVNVERGTRRYAVFEVSPHRKGDEAYFTAIAKQMEGGGRSAMLHELLHMELGDWHPARAIPNTEAIRGERVRSLKGLDHAMHDWLHQGTLPTYKPASGDKYVSTVVVAEVYNKHWRSSGSEKPMSTQRVSTLLVNLGFERQNKNDGRGFKLPEIKKARDAWDKFKFPAHWDDDNNDWVDPM
jgi:hypothetical protein